MKSRNAALVTLVVVSAVMIGAMCALLYIETRKLRAVQGSFDVNLVALKSSMMRDPFPTPKNIEATSNNVRTLADDSALLRREMNTGQVAVEAGMEPLTWLSLLTKRRKDLQDGARTANVRLPPLFSFGFEKYDAGTPPKVSDVRRLDLQLKTVEQICRSLYQSRVSEITKLNREQFEEQSGIAATHGIAVVAATATNEPPLFTKEHFSIGLKAREAALIELLNMLASNRMFTVVTLVRVTGNPGVDLRPPAKTGEETASDGKTGRKAVGFDDRPPSQRIITGRGTERPAEVFLELDVYEFGEPPKDASS